MCLTHKDNPNCYKDQTFSSKFITLNVKKQCESYTSKKKVFKIHFQMTMKPKETSLNKTTSKVGRKNPLYMKDGDQNRF